MGKKQIKKALRATMTGGYINDLYKGISNVKNNQNPVRRGLKYTGWVLLTPVAIPVTIGLDAIVLGCMAVVGPPVLIFHVGVSAIKWVDGFIDRFDENPNPDSVAAVLEKPKKDSVLNSSSEESSHSIGNSQVKILEKLQKNHSKSILEEYTQYTRNYIESFHQTIPYSVQIENLGLSKKDRLKFEPHLDWITKNYINIPVRLNEKLYDLSTLIACYQKNKMDPHNNIPFELSNITPARDVNEEIRQLIASLEKEKSTLIEKKNASKLDLDIISETSFIPGVS